MSIFRITIAIFLFFSLVTTSTVASTFIETGPRIESFKQIDGYSVGRINVSIQDKAGFLWLGSDQGLLRFDGQSIKAFRHQAKVKEGLPDDFINDMVLDDDGFIWIATYSGLTKFDPVAETFSNFYSQDNDPQSLSSNKLVDLDIGDNGIMWIASFGGLNRFDYRTGKNQRIHQTLFDPSQTSHLTVRKVLEDSLGRVWYTVFRQGLYRYDPKDNSNIKIEAAFKQPYKLQNNTVTTLYEDNDGSVWLGARSSIYRYEDASKKFHRFEIPLKSLVTRKAAEVRRIYQDSKDRIWVATLFNGINVLPKGHEKLINFNEGNGGDNAINAMRIYSMIEDRSGALWFSSMQSGLIKLKPESLNFDHLTSPPDQRLRISSLLANDDNSYYIASNNNLYIKVPGKPVEKLLDNIGYVVEMKQGVGGKLILDISPKGIFVYERDSKAFYEHAASNGNLPNLPNSNVQSMDIDKHGNLWLGQFKRAGVKRSGLFKYDLANDSYTHVINDFTIDDVLAFEDKVLIATRRMGLRLYDTQANTWHHIKADGYDTDRILTLFKDSKEQIWIGTANAGLAKLNIKDLSLEFIDKEDGLPSNYIVSIIEDHNSLIWLAAEYSLAVLNPDTQEIQTFGQNEGLMFNDFYPGLAIKKTDNRIVMASPYYLVEFSPDVLIQQREVQDYSVLLSDFRLLNKPVKTQLQDPTSVLALPINYTERLTLTYRDYLFSLNFASDNFKDNAKQMFAYRMTGFKEDWIETSANERTATFTSLPAGDYQLQIKTTRSDGSWSDNYRSIDLTVTPPWYLSTQAYIAYVLLTIAVVYLYIRIREARLVEQSKKLEQTVEERTEQLQKSRDQVSELLGQKERTFANISHEFKTPLTLILSPLESILNSTLMNAIPGEAQSKLEMMKRNGSRLVRMVEQMLELSRLDTAVNQNTRNYSLRDTLTVLLTSFQPLIESKSLKLSNNRFDDVVLTLKVDSLEMILTNLISNAIKYTPDNGEIEVNVKIDNGNALVEVKDTGMGISQENQALVFNRFTRASAEHDENIPGAGIGLALVKELVESHHGRISLVSEINVGSTFAISLPVNEDPNVKPDTIETISSTSQIEIDALMNKSSIIVPGAQAIDLNTNKPTILLIDDNADMLELLTDTLNAHYICVTAPNGEVGLEKAKELIPDLIISDVMMPGISGYEVAKGLKEEELTCHIPVILLTAKGDTDSRMEGWKQDIDDYLAKPFHPQELLLRIESLLSIRAILKKRFIQNSDTDGNSQSGNTVIAELSPEMSDKDSLFVHRLKEVINLNYSDSEFNRDLCAYKMGISERQLSRKMSALMNESFPDLLREHRLDRAVNLMQTGMQISQISDEVGFSALSYFGKCFKAKYGKTPKQFQKEVIL